MLRLLSIRNFVVVEALDVEFEEGFSVLTGETGAGKSILLDALGLLVGDRFESRQLRPGAERAELAAEFDLADAPAAAAWLAEQALTAGEEVLLRRVIDAQGKSRAWINGRPATLAQMGELGTHLVDLHGQHAHQTLSTAEAQRQLLDAFGGFASLAREVAEAWRTWRAAVERHEAAAQAARAGGAEREFLEARRRELSLLGVTEWEWGELSTAQTRLAHAAGLIEATAAAEAALAENDDAMIPRLSELTRQLAASAVHDPALREIVALLEPVGIELDEAARALRDYRRRLDLDPAELARVEARLSAIHDVARKHRVRPEALPALLVDTDLRLTALAEAADADALMRAADAALVRYRELAEPLSSKRRFAASELGHRVSAAMQELAMSGGRLEVALVPEPTPSSHGLEHVELRVASHPKQPLAPLARVASGGELSRIALAIQVVASEVGQVPTLIFDEVDTGIGGAVAATVGRQLQALGSRRQVLCVTHLAQVAAHGDAHYRVVKHGDGSNVATLLDRLKTGERVDELARMLSGTEITVKTRAHAKELFELHRRSSAPEGR